MRITFIMPCIGRHPGSTAYLRGWQMEPLGIGVLSALTPGGVQKVFYDDRMETIPLAAPTDLVCLSVETYTARRAYQIAAEYRRRGVPVVMGGFHPTLCPCEVEQHADAIVMGEAEDVWPALVDDALSGRLRQRYGGSRRPRLVGTTPDRRIFAGKGYVPLALVETARGCRFKCEFCSISSFFERSFSARPVPEVIEEVARLDSRIVFFVDDNIAVDRARARMLFEALIPLKIRWAAQVSMDIADDEELLRLMRRSGCQVVLIGFESLNPAVLSAMGKSVNQGAGKNGERVRRLRRHGISVYGTFVFGYDGDTRAAFEQTLDFTRRSKMFFAAFNHLVPFPGTPLYHRLKNEGRVHPDNWWLSGDYRFGQVAFDPDPLSREELSALCLEYRQRFYSPASIIHRGLDVQANCRDLRKAAIYCFGNLKSRREVHQRQALPLGVATTSPQPGLPDDNTRLALATAVGRDGL